jgi:hypothetical protein
MLLVDSEEPVTLASPWTHLFERAGDRWPIPTGANDNDCHLMVRCMENWLLADRNPIIAFFGTGFNPRQLPSQSKPIAAITKNEVHDALRKASSQCKTKAAYHKGQHSFDLLSRIDAGKVIAASQSARRFITALG